VVHEELCALLDLELLTVNFYDCVHLFVLLNGFFREAAGSDVALVQASTD
jgi:hypothetical protein